MSKARVIDGTGRKTGERELPEGLFGGEVHHAILHQVVTAQRAAGRSGTASTKTRSEVRGGGTKPWRQKGTGRARHGSVRSPIWVGGGTVFGPTPRDYSVRVNKKVRRAALRSALSDKASVGGVWIIDGFDSPKSRSAAAALQEAGLRGRTLVVIEATDESSATVDRAFRNLKGVAFSLAGSLAAYDVLAADAVLFTAGAFDAFTRREVSA